MVEPNGLYYMRARYYDPNVGRFISEDPKGFDGGDVNLMAYVGNNPVLLIDPLGLCGVDFGISAGGMDINIPVYNSKAGWFGAPSFGVSTTLIGMGAQIYSNNPTKPHRDTSNDIFFNFGTESSKYLSFSSNNDLTKGSVNIGVGLGVPYVNASTSVERFVTGLSNKMLQPATIWLGNKIQNALNR